MLGQMIPRPAKSGLAALFGAALLGLACPAAHAQITNPGIEHRAQRGVVAAIGAAAGSGRASAAGLRRLPSRLGTGRHRPAAELDRRGRRQRVGRHQAQRELCRAGRFPSRHRLGEARQRARIVDPCCHRQPPSSNVGTNFGDTLNQVQEIYGAGGDTVVHLVYAYAEESPERAGRTGGRPCARAERLLRFAALLQLHQQLAVRQPQGAARIGRRLQLLSGRGCSSAGCACAPRRTPTFSSASMR